MASPDPRASLVIPVRDGARTMGACLRAAREAMGRLDELIVVDDGSLDDSGPLASAAGATVITTPPRGAAAARNAGAAMARGRWLVFLDADVLLEPTALELLLAPLEAGQARAAIGTYAPCPPELGLASRVKDRSIRARHKQSGEEVGWFWTGLGAVERSLFLELGGFDAARFAGATVEDMELGYRLAAAGQPVRQVAAARLRHLHRHSLASLTRNDFAKARDWSATLRAHGAGRAGDHGATHPRELLGLACAVVGLGSLPSPAAWPAGALAWAGLGWLLREELREAWQARGLGEACGQLGLRALLYPVAAAGGAAGLLGRRRS
jgi:glycosyltransferase involved in cell wall biosynthesis